MDNDEKTREAAEIKERIIKNARRGSFDRNPLFSTVHFVPCPRCRHQQPTKYLDSLKEGTFKIKAPEEIEILSFLGPFDYVETQVSTPLVIELSCERCGRRIVTMPTNVEYALATLEQPRVAEGMYA